MKKILAFPALLFTLSTLLLTFSSCNEIQNINVDFGDRSYINDYSELIKTVNNKDSVLTARFDALNKLIESGMANLKLSIDRNTGAITVLNQTTKDGLDSVRASLFSGFSALTRHMDSSRDSIVNAININGQDLRARIDYNGNLISTQILTSAAAETSIKNAIDSLKLEVVNENLTQNSYLAQILNSLAILNNLDSTIMKNADANKEEIITAIKNMTSTTTKALTNEGIIQVKDTLYMIPEIWNTIEQKDSTSYFYQACLNVIKNQTAFSGTLNTDNFQLQHRGWIGNDGTLHNSGDAYLRFNKASLTGNALVVTDTITPALLGIGKKCVKVVKMPEEISVGITAWGSNWAPNDESNLYHWYYIIRVYDIRGDYQVFGAVTGSRDEFGDGTSSEFPMPQEIIQISTYSPYKLKLKLCSKGKKISSLDEVNDNFRVYLWEVATSKDGKYTIATGDAGTNKAGHGTIKWASEF